MTGNGTVVSWMGLTTRRGGLPLGAILGVVSLAGTGAVGVLHLDRVAVRICLFKTLTGWPCLTCGSTRTLGSLFSLDWAGAVAMNPLTAAAVLVIAAWGLADLLLWPSGRALALDLSPRSARIAGWVAVAFALANWLYLIAVGR